MFLGRFLILLLKELASRSQIAIEALTPHVIINVVFCQLINILPKNRNWSKKKVSFPFSCSTVKQQLGVFSWLHPQHTTAPLQLNCCSIGSPTHWISYSLLLFCAWPWDFRKHFVREGVCADSAACHRATWLLSCVFTAFTDLRAQQLGDLRGVVGGLGVGREDWWVTYHLMLPLLHNPFQRGGESAEGATEQNNWRQKEKEKRLPSP